MRQKVETRSAGGLVLGRYRIVSRLAQGGMGVVYLGRVEGAAGFSKAVVIKQVIPGSENAEVTTARFIREAQILSNLQHPGIVTVLDFGEEVRGHCMVLEYVHGYDLSKWMKFLQLKSTPMAWEHAVFIMLRVLDSLKYAHTFRRPDGTLAEILHRDVSPGNVLLDVEGRVRLADFGIARMEENDTDQYKTQTGVLQGKMTYLAPELFNSDEPSPSSDVYACGVVLFQMLTGKSPFAAEDKNKILWRILMDDATPIASLREGLPVGLVSAVRHAIEKEPCNRYQDVAAFAADLRCTLIREESEVATELREIIRRDFTGDLPELMGLEPLEQRDSAWRTASGMTVPEQEIAEAPGPKAASPRAMSHRERETARPPGNRGAVTPVVPPPDFDKETVVQPILGGDADSPIERGVVSEAPEPNKASTLEVKHLVLAGLALLVLVFGAGVFLFFVLKETASPAEDHFIVVGDRKPAFTSVPAVPAESEEFEERNSPEPPERVVAPPVRQPRPRKKPRKESATAALARQVGKNRAALHKCFTTHASSVQGQPLLHLTFTLNQAGKATDIGLKPEELAATGLGKCLLQVAHRTRFEPQAQPVSFSIPIRARKGKK